MRTRPQRDCAASALPAATRAQRQAEQTHARARQQAQAHDELRHDIQQFVDALEAPLFGDGLG